MISCYLEKIEELRSFVLSEEKNINKEKYSAL